MQLDPTSPSYDAYKAFCQNPSESIDVECKLYLDVDKDSDLAILTVAVIAMANHGGGHVVLGVRDNKGSFSVEGIPDDAIIDPDRIRSKINKRLNTPVHISDHVISVEVDGHNKRVLFLQISSDSRIPVMAHRPIGDKLREHIAYIRTPKPESCPPTSYEHWDNIFRTCMSQRYSDISDLISHAISSVHPANPEPDSWRFHNMLLEPSGKHFARVKGFYRKIGIVESVFHISSSSPALYSDVRRLVAARPGNSGWPMYPMPTSEENKSRLSTDGVNNTYIRDHDFWIITDQLDFYQARDLSIGGELFAKDGKSSLTRKSLNYPRMMVQIYDLLDFYSYMADKFPDCDHSRVEIRVLGTDRCVLSDENAMNPSYSSISEMVLMSSSIFKSMSIADRALITRTCLQPLFDSYNMHNPSLDSYSRTISESQLWRNPAGGHYSNI